jgi:hypothetical protein
LLANLWARGAALQCCFNQKSIDFLIPIYIGSIVDTDRFNPSNLSVVAGQVKFKDDRDKQAGFKIRPIGIPRDRHQPLPYLALLMELGNNSKYSESNSKIFSIPSASATSQATYSGLADQLDVATKPAKDGGLSQGKIKEIRQDMGSFNRYCVFVRGASPDTYGVLKTAHIEEAFSKLLRITMAFPNKEDHEIQHMLPLNRLVSGYAEWMLVYGGETDGGETDGGETDGGETDDQDVCMSGP